MTMRYSLYLIRHWAGVVVVATAAISVVGPVFLVIDGARNLARRLSALA